MDQTHEHNAADSVEEKSRNQRFSKRVSQLTRLLRQSKEKGPKETSKNSFSSSRDSKAIAGSSGSSTSKTMAFHRRVPSSQMKSSHHQLSASSTSKIVIGEPHLESGSLIDSDKYFGLDHTTILRRPTLPVPIPGRNKPDFAHETRVKDNSPLNARRSSEESLDVVELDGNLTGPAFAPHQAPLASIESSIELPPVLTFSNVDDTELSESFLLRKFDEIKARLRDSTFPLPSPPPRAVLREPLESPKLNEQGQSLNAIQNHDSMVDDRYRGEEDFDFAEILAIGDQTKSEYNDDHFGVKLLLDAEQQSFSFETNESDKSFHTGGTSNSSIAVEERRATTSVDAFSKGSTWGSNSYLAKPESSKRSKPASTIIESPEFDFNEYTVDEPQVDGLKLMEEFAETIRIRERIRAAGRLTGVPHFLPLNHLKM